MLGEHADTLSVADGSALVDDVWREFLRPAPRMTVTEWAESYRVMSDKDSAEPGPYRVSRTPYAREPMDCLSMYSQVEEVVLMWGAQTGKTSIGSNWIGYLIDHNPGPVMIVQPTIDMAKRYSRQRLSPMIEVSPALRRKVRENRSRDDANTTLLKEFAGGFMAITGANSAAGLRSMPVRDVFLDEVDGYPLDVDGEGDPCMLAEARQSTFARRKRLRTSTPTTKDMSRIETAFEAADRCRYHVPCPHCQEFQPLVWGNDTPHGLRWDRHDDGRPDFTRPVRYICRACGGEILEHHKSAMLPAGRWVPEVPGARRGRVRSFHLSSLYAPLGWVSWDQLVTEWHAATVAQRSGDSSLLRVFINTRLAQTFEETGDKIAAHELARRAEPWRLGTVPWGGLVLVDSVDVQGARLEAARWAMGRGEESWLIDVRVFHGDPALAEDNPGSPWADLTAWRRTTATHASGAAIRSSACAVDSGGHHTQQVYTYARRYAHERVIAVKGSSQSARPILGKPTDVEVNHRGQRLRTGTKLWLIGTDTAKSVIYGRLRLQDPGPGYMHFSTETPGDVYDQITAERLRTKLVQGRPKLEWIKPVGRRNEQLDLAVYALAAFHYLGVPRYRPQDWHRLEARFGQRGLFEEAATPIAAGTDPAATIGADPAPGRQEPAPGQEQAPSPPPPAPQPPPAAPARPQPRGLRRAGGISRRW